MSSHRRAPGLPTDSCDRYRARQSESVPPQAIPPLLGRATHGLRTGQSRGERDEQMRWPTPIGCCAKEFRAREHWH
jgi:hypothetical protein